MPQPKTDNTAALSQAVDALLDIADDLQEEKKSLHGRVAANRDTLRNYVKMGVTSAEQNADIRKLYADRTRKPKEAA